MQEVGRPRKKDVLLMDNLVFKESGNNKRDSSTLLDAKESAIPTLEEQANKRFKEVLDVALSGSNTDKVQRMRTIFTVMNKLRSWVKSYTPKSLIEYPIPVDIEQAIKSLMQDIHSNQSLVTSEIIIYLESMMPHQDLKVASQTKMVFDALTSSTINQQFEVDEKKFLSRAYTALLSQDKSQSVETKTRLLAINEQYKNIPFEQKNRLLKIYQLFGDKISQTADLNAVLESQLGDMFVQATLQVAEPDPTYKLVLNPYGQLERIATDEIDLAKETVVNKVSAMLNNAISSPVATLENTTIGLEPTTSQAA